MRRIQKNDSGGEMLDQGGWVLFSRSNAVAGFFTLVIPFAIFYWMLPFFGKHTIGNDYTGYWIRQQLFLMFSVHNGSFPLYAPGFAGGWTSSAMTLGQLWHPISWIASIIPGYWEGHAHEIVTLLRLLSLGVTHLVLYLFLRRLKVSYVIAFVLSFIAVYNLRMLDMFRYAAALENYTAFLLLSAAIGWHYLSRKKWKCPVLIVFCSWLLTVGGHPQMMYLGFVGAGIVCLVMPFYTNCMQADEIKSDSKRILHFYFSTAISVLLGIGLASIFILPYYFEYLPDSWRSEGLDFKWACSFQDSLGGSICNFFSPFHSDAHAAFGGSFLFIAAALVPLLYLLKVRVPKLILVLWSLFALIFLMTLGSNGPVYYYFWKYFPMAQNFRVPGRIGFLLPFLAMLILGWASKKEGYSFRLGKSPLVLLAGLSFFALIILNSIGLDAFNLNEVYSPARINEIPISVFRAVTIAGIVSLLVLFIYGCLKKSNFKRVVGIIFIVAVFVQLLLIIRFGTWVVPGPKVTRTFDQIKQEQQQRISYRHYKGYWSKPVVEHISRSFLEPSLARVCSNHTAVGSQEDAYKKMASSSSIDHIYIEDYPASKASRSLKDDQVSDTKLTYNTFNNMRFDVKSSDGDFFVFSLPSNYWRAYVDGERKKVYRCNGLEHAVSLKAGEHEVEFRYWSLAGIVGGVITFSVLLLILLWYFANLHGLLRISGLILSMIICVLGFCLWYHSLYNGANIGTEYAWNSKDIERHLNSEYNFAYGKPTMMSAKTQWPYTRVSSRGVDGQRGGDFGFVTAKSNNMAWMTDIGKVKEIGEIVLYKHGDGNLKNALPFDVVGSTKGKQWFLIKTINEDVAADHWRIKVNNVKARYVRLQARGHGRLALSEVEIYGPDGTGEGD